MDINTLFKQFMQDPEFAAAFNEPLEEELIQSSSNKALQQNIKTEIDSGKSPKQAAAIAYSIQRKNENMNLEENTITSTLPPSIDKFLMDMSQMYIDAMGYEDILKFGERATEEDIKQLRKYKRELSQGFEEDDPEIQEIFKHIKNIVKGNLKEAMTNKEKLMKRFPELNLKEDWCYSLYSDDEDKKEIKTVYGFKSNVEAHKAAKEDCAKLGNCTFEVYSEESMIKTDLDESKNANTKLNKQEVLDWISEHELAWEDFVNYFEDIYQSSAEVPMDEIMGWISYHDDLAEDFENKFGISVNADVCDDDCDWFEDELEEHVAVDSYDQLNSSNIIEIKPSGLKESILDIFKKKPYLVVDKRHNNKILSKHATKEEAQEAAENAGGFWRSVYVMTADELKSREQGLKKEAQKKVKGWGLRDLRDGTFVYTFDTEDEARNHFKRLAYSQQMRFSVDPILESINSSDEKWNIGSNKLISTDSQEYANLVDLAKLLQERSPNHYEYRVEKTYEDFGAGMQWYTIICDEKNGWGTHQVLNPKQWLDLANTGDIEGVYQDIISNKYFQDTAEKSSIFNKLYTFDE